MGWRAGTYIGGMIAGGGGCVLLIVLVAWAAGVEFMPLDLLALFFSMGASAGAVVVGITIEGTDTEGEDDGEIS